VDWVQVAAVIAWLLVPGLGIRAWLLEGRGWFASLSWTIPLAGWLILDWFIVRPALVSTIAYFVGLAALFTMVVSDRAIGAWYRFVLRRPLSR
jgi:hypothetical protein